MKPPLKTFLIEYEYKTRPWFHKGRWVRIKIGFCAENQTDVYRLAKTDGETRFGRRRWKILGCEEVEAQRVQF